MQQGDVPRTFADVDELIKDYKYTPSTDIKSGIQSFVKWFKAHKFKEKKYLVYIKHPEDGVMLWKSVENVPVLIEYDLNF